MGKIVIFGIFAWLASSAALAGPLEDALATGDLAKAYEISVSNYEAAEKGSEAAGVAAFQAARIAEARTEFADAAKYYDRCADTYRDLNQIPQASDCRYRAGTAWKSAGKAGTARDTFAKGLRELEESGNQTTATAVVMTLALADLHKPERFDTRSAADGDRRRVIGYTESARAILTDLGQTENVLMADALVLEGRMYDGLAEDEAAREAYMRAREIYFAAGDAYVSQVEDIDLRMRTLRAEAGRGKSKPFTAKTLDGREVDLKIKKRRNVRFPRLEGNLMVEAAKVDVLVTLGPDGDVAKIDVLKSSPDAVFGEAVKKAMLTWRFTATDETPADEILPFTYGMVFYLSPRRR